MTEKRNRPQVSCTECRRRKQKCNRELPCRNCRCRGKQSLCSYDGVRPLKNASYTEAESRAHDASVNQGSKLLSLSSVAATWGYAQQVSSTVDLLKRLEVRDDAALVDESSTKLSSGLSINTLAKIGTTYAEYVQQLPQPDIVLRLVQLFMDSLNWQYGIVDMDIIRTQFQQWQQIPLTVLASVTRSTLSGDLKAFPAVLFQIMASALLLVGEEPRYEVELDAWKRELALAGRFTSWLELAIRYSEIGTRICRVLDKDELSLTTVQAQFLRAAFQKFTSNTKGSWHTVAETIRDAQELGMHSDLQDPTPDSNDPKQVLETQRLVQRRRKIYMLLVTWDIKMSVFMGRPGITNPFDGAPTAPIDSQSSTNGLEESVTPRIEGRDPPTPLTKSLWLYRIAMMLREISKLASDGPQPKDWSKVDKLHQDILDLEAAKPAVLRLECPDTQWDDDPTLHWLQGVRYYLAQDHHFCLMVLHRRYMFHRPESCYETLQSSLNMLRLQKGMFDSFPASSWRNHMLFYGAFDALVQISTIFLLFPGQYPCSVEDIERHFGWVMERFTQMSTRNATAKSALKVLMVLRAMVLKAPREADTGTQDSDVSPPISFSKSMSSPDKTEASYFSYDKKNSSADVSHDYSIACSLPQNAMTESSLSSSAYDGSEANVAVIDSQLQTWLPQDFAPILPTYDLLFNDLGAAPFDQQVFDQMYQTLQAEGVLEDEMIGRFDGDFEDGSIWHYLNET